MRCLPTLAASLLMLGTAVSSGTLLTSQSPAHAQSAETVAKVAQSITVRLEGATQGSGVIVKRDGNHYTVLTAWHVVSGQRPGEELDIFTPDEQRHQLEQGSIRRLGEVDLAVLTFSSSNSYVVALVADVKSVNSGSSIYVSGFPLPTSAVPSRIWRFLKGDVIANATVAIPNGYQLLYSNQTLPGMSGGAVLNGQGQLVGIHGQGETDSKLSEQSDVAVKTGTNQAVPIAYYSQYSSGAAVVASSSQSTTADDFLAQAKALIGKKGSEQEVIRLSGRVLATRQSAEAYFYRAFAKSDLDDNQGAIADYSQAIAIKPQDAFAYNNRGNNKKDLGDMRGAIIDFSQAIAINTQFAGAYSNRGTAKSDLGDKQGAIADYNQAIEIDPQLAAAYNNRGTAKSDLGDKQGAIAEYSQAIAVNPSFSEAFYNRGKSRADLGDKRGAITDYSQAIALNPRFVLAYRNRGTAKFFLSDTQGAISDYSHAVAISPNDSDSWAARGLVKSLLSDKSGACDDLRKSSSLGSPTGKRYFSQICQ